MTLMLRVLLKPLLTRQMFDGSSRSQRKFLFDQLCDILNWILPDTSLLDVSGANLRPLPVKNGTETFHVLLHQELPSKSDWLESGLFLRKQPHQPTTDAIATRLLTEAGGLRCVPLAQFSAVGHVPALQDESSMAAVMKRGPLHRWPGWLHRHPPVLQGDPDSRAQLHWKPARRTITQEVTKKERTTSPWLKLNERSSYGCKVYVYLCF